MFRKKKEQLELSKDKCIKSLAQFSNDLIDGTIRKLYQIQDVENLDVSEQEKDVHRNIIIDNSVKELLNFSDEIKSILQTAKSL